jgi:hypothetical protein
MNSPDWPGVPVALALLPSNVMQGMIRSMRAAAWAVAWSLCACGPGDPATPDGPVGAGGLVVQWESTPASWPAQLGDGVVLDRASFAVDNLRVIGDAGPGDPRTTASNLDVRWDSNTQPAAITLPEAPSGLYSQLSLLIDGQLTERSYELRGEAMIGDSSVDLRIRDDDPLAFTHVIDQTLAPGGGVTITVRVKFAHALDALDLPALVEDGRIDLQTGDPAMVLFRAKLIESFEVETQLR